MRSSGQARTAREDCPADPIVFLPKSRRNWLPTPMSRSHIVLATASRWRARLLEDTGLAVELVPAPIDESTVGAEDAVSLALARAAAKADAVWGLIVDGSVDEAQPVQAAGWGERYRELLQQINSNEVLQIAAAVRTLRARPPMALSFGERKMLQAAEAMLSAVIVIGADQVAHLDGEAFGKPVDPDDHRARLRALRGRTHVLSTGVSFRGPGAVALGRAADFVEHTSIHFRADVTDAEINAYVASGDGSGCAGGYRAEGPGAWLIARVEGDWSNVIGLPVFGVLDRLRRCGVDGFHPRVATF